MDDAKERPSSQKLIGHGANVAGDFIGSMEFKYELMDPQTKAHMAKLASSAPEVARVVDKALRDGLMSPDAVAALERAAHIDMDVASLLNNAGQNINWDVAQLLHSAAQNINNDVANRFYDVNRELTERVGELNGTADSLRDLIRQANTDTAAVSRTVGVVSAPTPPTPPAPRRPGGWRTIPGVICWSAGAGLIVAAVLMRIHLGVYAWLAGIWILIAAMALQFAKPQR